MTTATPTDPARPAGPKPAPAAGPPEPAGATSAGAAGTASPDRVDRTVPRFDEVPMTGAQSLVRSLEEVGCEVVFGIPGGTILPAYDPLLDSTRVRHVLVRHEQGAGHAATGYAQATGKVGVCMATSGPGATNLVTPIADAHMDSIPRRRDHRAAVPAADRHRRLPGSRHHRHHPADHQAQHAGDRRAGHPAGDRRGVPPGQHGPTRPGAGGHPEGRAAGADHVHAGRAEMQLPGYRPTTRPHGKQIREAAKLICAARKPVLYVGGGVLKAEASDGAAARSPS